jgi:ABC-2 type transport system permease protein
LRQRNRVIGALGQPILFWLLFGAGLQQSFRAGEAAQSFLKYYFPGTLILIILFTAIFATISIIEDRREGFLQAVLVAPIPAWSMVLGKVLGGSILALGQAVVFLLLALTIHISMSPITALHVIALLFVTSIALTSLGVVIAWRMDSTQGFHAIMNLLLMPMWLLSGAFFPVPALTAGSDAGQVVLHWVMRLNPLTYCLAGVRQLMFDSSTSKTFWAPPTLVWCWVITLVFAVLTFAAAWRISRHRVSGDMA